MKDISYRLQKRNPCATLITNKMPEDREMKKGKKRVITIVAAVLAFLIASGVAGLFVAAKVVYDKSFGYRCTTSPGDTFIMAQFPGLNRQRHTFRSNQGQELVGYLYDRSQRQTLTKGVIVFAHGLGGGGQTGYMDIFDHFTKQGFCVFAYDATGNDESEGKVIGGLPQGYIDLDHAIDYVGTLEEVQGLPVLLMGYSWGGLSVANVLNYHPEVKAVVAVAGCNRTLDLIEYQGRERAGKAAKLLMPFAAAYEWMKYGRYAGSTAMDGFANSSCDVMIIHGARDTVVPISCGYETYFEKYGQDPRFTFKKFNIRGHDVLNYTNGNRDFTLLDDIVRFFDKSICPKDVSE